MFKIYNLTTRGRNMFSPKASTHRRKSSASSAVRQQQGGSDCLYKYKDCEWDNACKWDPNANDGVGKCVPKNQGGGGKGKKPVRVGRSFATRKQRMVPAPHYDLYIARLLKQVHQPDTRLTSKTMILLNAFVKDMIHRISTRAANLCKKNNRVTISARDIQSAVRLELPGELHKHAVLQGTRAVTQYTSSSKK